MFLQPDYREGAGYSIAKVLMRFFWLACFCCPQVSPAAISTELSTQLSAAAASYWQGRVTSAVATLKAVTDHEIASGDMASQQVALEYLLDTCVGGLDYPCLQTYAPIYDHLIATRPDIPDVVKRAFALHVAYYFGVSGLFIGQRSAATAWLKSVPESVGEELFDSRNYIRRQLLRARLYLILEDYGNAQLCVDRVLMTIASVKNSGSSYPELTFWLSDAIEILTVLGETERALGLVQTDMAFGQKVLPPNSLEFYWLLERSAGVFQAVGSYAQAKDLALRASDTLSKLELAPNVANYLRAQSSIAIAMMCLMLGDLECADAQLNSHPTRAMLAEVRKRGVLRDFPEVSYFSMQAVINAVQRRKTDEVDADLLSKPTEPQYPMPEQLQERLELYRRVGHALTVLSSDLRAGREELHAIAPELLRIELEGPTTIGPLRRLDAVQHLMNDLVLMSFASQDLDAMSGDYVVRLLDLESRNGTSFSVEALALMAAAKDEDQREAVRSILRLTGRRDAAERADIGALLAAKPKLDPTKAATPIELDLGRRTRYSDYGRAIRRLANQVTNSQPELGLAIRPPSLQTLQSVLAEREAVVGAPLLLGGLVANLCVRHDAIVFSTSTPNIPKLIGDVKLVNAALTAQYPPSPELDSQFPISAARDLFEAQLGPVKPCLRLHDSILWIGQAPREAPLAALLTEGSTGSLSGTPLSQWPWFVNSYDVSYVESSATLVALRRRRVPWEPESSAQFAGIGDPLFSGTTPDGEDRARLAMRGAIGVGGLSVLPSLPDTKTELEEIGSLFPQRSTVLTEGGATEAAFRRLPLEKFRYLSFATHGLVREDINGLTEPALALTPESATDPFDDGLLTASEIADLPLRARFVALSACNTAALDFTKYASEVPALSAAFEVDGVSSVLATLWPVESDTSKRIVREIFQQLVAGTEPAAALAKSQRDYLIQPPSVAQSHPRFWAPFAIFGDSVSPTTNRDLKIGSQIGMTRLLTTSGGDVQSILSNDTHRGFVLGGIGDIRKGHRHASLTIDLDMNLREQWRYENDEIGYADAVPVREGLLAVGYRGGGDNPLKLSIESLRAGGEHEREWTLTREPDDLYPGSAIRLGEKSIVVGVDQHPQWKDPAVKPADERLLLLEARWGEPAQVRVDMKLGSNGMRTASLAKLGGSVLVALSEMFAPTKEEHYFDEFHELRGCFNGPRTELMLFDPKSWTLQWRKELPGIAMQLGANSADGTAYFAGLVRKSCDEGNRMGFWAVTRAREIKPIYVDSGSAETQSTGLDLRPDGSALLFGKVERITDVASMEERDTDVSKIIARGNSMRVNYSTRQTSDLLMVEVGSAGELISREVVRAGSDLYVRGAVSVGKNIWMYGSLGEEAALMQLQERQ